MSLYEDYDFEYHISIMVTRGHIFEQMKKAKDHILFLKITGEIICSKYGHLVIAAWLSLQVWSFDHCNLVILERSHSQRKTCKLNK